MSTFSVFWNVYGECDNFHVINSAHSGAILDLHFSSPDSGGNSIYTASTDKTVGVFDVASGSRSLMLSRLEIFENIDHGWNTYLEYFSRLCV